MCSVYLKGEKYRNNKRFRSHLNGSVILLLTKLSLTKLFWEFSFNFYNFAADILHSAFDKGHTIQVWNRC